MKFRRKTVIYIVWSLLAVLSTSGCASLTGRKRFLLGTGLGAGLGAAGGAVFSPNQESRMLNTLVFGLSGALLGGVAALLTDSKPEVPKSQGDLKAQESLDRSLREFQVTPNQQLPKFVRERIQPLVIEEFIEEDSVSEDGTLHEPHKAYRVKRSGELFAKPIQSGVHDAKN